MSIPSDHGQLATTFGIYVDGNSSGWGWPSALHTKCLLSRYTSALHFAVNLPTFKVSQRLWTGNRGPSGNLDSTHIASLAKTQWEKEVLVNS